jgi:hypothetical protein
VSALTLFKLAGLTMLVLCSPVCEWLLCLAAFQVANDACPSPGSEWLLLLCLAVF